ncbi:hypothetical protein [Mycobacterium intracellulare]|uniref:hypothetical protein n=1 Tax=Mycobacterium intracellulare TaxID=1767 RepID=UPI0011AB4CC6|nr:hypothetical protein [Mycobacterium intracellulare]
MLQVFRRSLNRLLSGVHRRILLRLRASTLVADQSIKERRLRRAVNDLMPVSGSVHRILGRRDRHRVKGQPTSRVEMGLLPVGEHLRVITELGRQRVREIALHLVLGVIPRVSHDLRVFVMRARPIHHVLLEIGDVRLRISRPMIADHLIGAIRLRLLNIPTSHGDPPPNR